MPGEAAPVAGTPVAQLPVGRAPVVETLAGALPVAETLGAPALGTGIPVAATPVSNADRAATVVTPPTRRRLWMRAPSRWPS